MMDSRNPFVKLMIIGRINQRIKDMLSKPALNEIDVKLLKGLFWRNCERKPPKKGIFDTFAPDPECGYVKSKIVRRFRSFVLRGSIEEENIKPPSLITSLSSSHKQQKKNEKPEPFYEVSPIKAKNKTFGGVYTTVTHMTKV